ncbi:MAG: FadR family transcriptional regulator [Dethiobacter sp.]|nr:FadR family transcriptional regulator [Dethiobacter sp.]MBS3901026.1 FadR family transcriptional regulator [Dethiobacter sp.]MBS3990436.1 FadR family transcriptional regulator [Dethiobacter sp.]
MFRPIRQKRVYEEILCQIKDLLAKGALKPGDRLFSERELADMLQVSRASIREAFSALDMLGILESKPGEGTFIRQSPHESAFNPLALVCLLYGDSNLQMMEVRMILEAESAAMAAKRASQKDLEKISACLEQMESDIAGNSLGELPDAQFHLAVAEATGNKVLQHMMDTISGLIVETLRHSRQQLFQTLGNKEKLLAQHKKIFQAISSKNPEQARAAMKEHLRFVIEKTMAYEAERTAYTAELNRKAE